MVDKDLKACLEWGNPKAFLMVLPIRFVEFFNRILKTSVTPQSIQDTIICNNRR